jgi:hypothetical protein
MKKLIITCVLLSSVSLVSFAQQAQQPQTTATMQTAAGPQAAPRQMPQISPEQRAERAARNEERRLALSPEQYKSAYEVELAHVRKIEEIKTKGQASPAEFKAANEVREEKLSKIFTAEQMTKYKEMMNRQRPPMPAPPTAAPTPGVPAK